MTTNPFPAIPPDRIARLYGEISANTATDLVEQFLRLDVKATAPILLYIFSPGGCVLSGLAIADTLRHLRSPVYTVGIGMIASMASVLLAIGCKGHRFLLPHARVMIHQARGATAGRETAIESGYQLFRGLSADIETILCQTTGQPREVLQRALEKEVFFSAREAIEFGLADAVLESHEA